MANSPTYWDKRAIKRLTDAEKQSEVYIKRIQKMYDNANKNIQRDIENIYANYSKATGLDVQSLKTLLTKTETQKLWDELKVKGLDQYVKGNYKARISRLEKLQAQIYAKAKEIYPKEQLEHTICYEGIINNSYYKTIYDTQMGTGLDFAFSNIDENMVKALLNERWSGKNYSQRIWGNTDILAESLSEIIGGAMLSGQSIQKTARQIRERFDVSKYYAERLVRTEVNHFNNEADAMAYEEMDVEKYVFLATLDTRTSTICQSLDNKAFELKKRRVGENFPPMHPNCRSKTRAYMGEEIEKTLKRRARNPITGKNEIVGNISYEEWAKQHGLDKPTLTSGQSVNKNIIQGTTEQKTNVKNLKNAIKPNIIKDNPFNFKTINSTHTILDDIGNTDKPICNPNLSKGGDYAYNCGYSSVTYEMRRRGFDVEANPRKGLHINEWSRMFKGFAPKKPQTENVLTEMIKDIETWGDGARGIVGGKWKMVSGHYFNFEVVNGKCVFVCPQTGRYDVSMYFDKLVPSSIVYGRTDNLEPSELIKYACKNKG